MADPSVQRYFSFDLRTPEGAEAGMLVQFPDVEAACCDLYAGMPDTAADLFRKGLNPLDCAYIVRDEHGVALLEISFAELLAGAPTSRRQPSSDAGWLRVNAELKVRSDRAVARLDGATARILHLTARANAIASQSVGSANLSPGDLLTSW